MPGGSGCATFEPLNNSTANITTMKSLFRRSLVAPVIIWLALLSVPVQAAEYFVVIGAFSNEPHAVKFANQARMYFEEVAWSYNDHKKMFYVHVMKTSRQEEAADWSLYIKQQTQFKDAWVLAHSDAEAPVYASANGKANQADYASDHNYGSPNNAHRSDVANAEALAWTASRELSYIGNINDVKSLRSKPGFAAAHMFKFIIENHIGNAIDSEVKLVDFAKVKKIASFKSGEVMAVRGTKREQVITLVCDVLGYAMETKMFNLDHLARSKDIRLNKDGVWEVRFKLKRMSVNDISFMHKTTFYQDAAVLHSSSKDEMNELLSLLMTHPGYRIVIHIHCNPAGKRDIILPGKTKNYFDLQDTEVKSGSDKKLTTARGEVIRTFLVDNGIDEDRLRVVGWGSQDLLTPATAADAAVNDRIEIELVD